IRCAGGGRGFSPRFREPRRTAVLSVIRWIQPATRNEPRWKSTRAARRESVALAEFPADGALDHNRFPGSGREVVDQGTNGPGLILDPGPFYQDFGRAGRIARHLQTEFA